MQSTPKHGLAGKARRVRDITRSHRLHSRQLIDEYLDWQTDEEEPERVIPIKRGGQFLPCAEYVQSSSPDDSGAGQFEFVHTPSGEIVDTAAVVTQPAPVVASPAPVAEVKPAAAPKPAMPVVQAEVAPKAALPAVPDVVRTVAAKPTIPAAEKPAVIRPVRLGTSYLPVAVPEPSLSTRGLLVGCAIGTVGAGALLAVASLLLG